MKSTSIIPCGAFFPKTAAGYLINPCSEELIAERYKAALEEIVAAYIEREGDNLHSLYLRGSVPRAMQIGDCDLDTFALVFTETDRWRVPVWAAPVKEALKKQYAFLSDVEFYLSSYAPVLRSFSETGEQEGAIVNPNLAMIIKTQSLCLFGKDIRSQIPPYRADESMMLAKQWLAEDMAAFVENKSSEVDRQQFLKTLLRSGFELVMPRIQQYTPDLYLCYSSFAHYYPKKGKQMRKALYCYLNTEEQIGAKVLDLGTWLVDKLR